MEQGGRGYGISGLLFVVIVGAVIGGLIHLPMTFAADEVSCEQSISNSLMGCNLEEADYFYNSSEFELIRLKENDPAWNNSRQKFRCCFVGELKKLHTCVFEEVKKNCSNSFDALFDQQFKYQYRRFEAVVMPAPVKTVNCLDETVPGCPKPLAVTQKTSPAPNVTTNVPDQQPEQQSTSTHAPSSKATPITTTDETTNATSTMEVKATTTTTPISISDNSTSSSIQHQFSGVLLVIAGATFAGLNF